MNLTGSLAASGGASASRKAVQRDLPLIDLGKAVASQCIVWHHFVIYGPMAATAEPLAPDLMDWLAEHGRLAVQVFLVMAGFLAASVLGRPGAAGLAWGEVPARTGVRFLRLARPYWVAMAMAVLAAAVARALVDEPSTPAPPDLAQLLAHALMLQDLVGVEALSAGVWYVAIDLQLHLMLLLVAAALSAVPPGWRRAVAPGAVGVLVAVSWMGFNLDPAHDVWAPYFFGAYGAGVLAALAAARFGPGGSATDRRVGAAIVVMLALLIALALLEAWRSRVVLAGAVALVLAFGGAVRGPDGPVRRLMGGLAAISYAVFLVHYPVVMAVGAVVERLWPGVPEVHAAGLLAAWGLTLAAGAALHRLTEPAPARR